MISRCYLEITNICNLDCLFCPKNNRPKRCMTMEEFDFLTERLCGKVRFLYFHLMGEPMVHPHLSEFIQIARRKKFIPVLTTNGTLCANSQKVLEAKPHKIQISLHSYEGNGKNNPEHYINEVMLFAKKAASLGIIVVMRLWNQGGYNSKNNYLLDLISQYQPRPWIERNDGWKLDSNLYIEYDRMFEWPDRELEAFHEEKIFCYALRNQVGVLVDGSVVPCCLDHEGVITLGNLFEQPLDVILSSSRAKAIYDGFTAHKSVEPLCRRCGYALDKKYRS